MTNADAFRSASFPETYGIVGVHDRCAPAASTEALFRFSSSGGPRAASTGSMDRDVYAGPARDPQQPLPSRQDPSRLSYRPRPRISLVPLLAEDDWAHNMLVRPHNAIRRMVEQAYHMIDAFFLHPALATALHTRLFFQWWSHVASLLVADFDATVNVILHRLAGSAPQPPPRRLQPAPPPPAAIGTVDALLPPELNKRRIRFVAGVMEELTDSFSDVAYYLDLREPVDTMARVMKHMEAFKPILDYYTDMERTLPKFLTRAATAADGLRLQQDYWKHVARRGPHRALHHLMLLHAMDPKDAHWAKRNLLTIKARIHFNTHVDRFKAAHLDPARLILTDLTSRDPPITRPVATPLADSSNRQSRSTSSVAREKKRRFRFASFTN